MPLLQLPNLGLPKPLQPETSKRILSPVSPMLDLALTSSCQLGRRRFMKSETEH